MNDEGILKISYGIFAPERYQFFIQASIIEENLAQQSY